MSYFDDVFEPSLLTEPKLLRPSRHEKQQRRKKQRQIEKLRSGIWLSADGPIRIESMSDSHLRNALNLVTQRDRDEVDRAAREVLEMEVKRREKATAGDAE